MNDFIKTRDDVIDNIKTLYYYLRNRDDTEFFNFASQIIKNGRVYVVEIIDSHICFAPSRFVGYKDNTLEKHKANNEKNGNDTNAVLYSLYTRITDDRLNSLFQKELAMYGLSSHNKDFWIPKGTSVDILLNNAGITIKRYWLARVTSDDYWQQALDNHIWLTQQRYGIQNSTAVTQILDCVRNIKTDDVILLAYGNEIYAYGNVMDCPFASNQVSSLADVIKNNKHQYNDGIVRFADSDVFYEDLKDGCENWGQRIVVDQWHYYLENTSVTTQGITLEINQGNQRMSICGVSEKFATEKINELKKQFEMKDLFISRISKLLSENHNIILQGAPGTGKTYLAKQIAIQMILEKEYDEKTASDDEKKKLDKQCGFVQFHPSYDYTDFVEGLRPINDKNGNVGFERRDGIFMTFCRKALEAYKNTKDKKNSPKYVFIIDEINRGEISKIFGELFFSIDPGYRGTDGAVYTQYGNIWKEVDCFDGGKKFYIPENVYIIGTMNDIDRSVESMDFAFRRRFAFREITAKESQQMLYTETAMTEKVDEIIGRMNALNDAICPDKHDGSNSDKKGIEGLSSAYHIGASYFMKLVNYKNEDGSFDYNQLWNNHLKGLLFEYLRGMPDSEGKLKTLENAFFGKQL